MRRKKKVTAPSSNTRFEQEEEDKVFEQRIKYRTDLYDAQFKGDIERIYREYISSRHWAERKVRYYKTHKKECALCHSTSHVELNHIYYGNFGFEKDEDLIPLCRGHHEMLHRHIGVSKDMRYATADFIEWQRRLLKGSELA